MSNITEDRMYFHKEQKVNLQELNCDGTILDIGGGGEGVIGNIFKEKVIAIDPRRDELEEALEGPVKLVMDARNMDFLDNMFDYVTSFFTLMYIAKKDHKKVLQEMYRVLKPNGKVMIWDTCIPKPFVEDKDIYVVQLDISTKDKNIKTGYGTKWSEEKIQDISYYIKLCEDVGFSILDRKEGEIFSIVLQK
ncbi:methyltransferase domain-containing protein [Clostridiaceae bacterium M8S5]|nr:methyltransferase domain-containing protein [Clostridiaceae bacterium M8S5]